MATLTKKFSEFTNAGDISNDAVTVGLADGTNARFVNPWTFLAPGTTAERPEIDASMYYRLRFNTTIPTTYEFYDPVAADWIQIEDSGDINDLIARLASHDESIPPDTRGAGMIGLENQALVTDKTVQNLAEANFIVKSDTSTLVNGFALSSLSTGILVNETATGDLVSRTITGTADQIDVANGTGLSGNPTLSLSAAIDAPGTFTIQGTVALDAIIDDDTMATATDTNVPTAESVVAYINAHPGAAGGTTGELQWNNAGLLDGDSITTDGAGNWAGTLGLTGQLNVDNLRLDGNTISSTNTNGDLSLIPNGDGSVIIGSTSQALSAVGKSTLYLNADQLNALLIVGSFINSPSSSSSISSIKSRSNTVTGHATVLNNDTLGQWNVYGDDGTDYSRSANISCLVDGAVSTGVIPGRWTFSTADSSGALTLALTIDSDQVATFQSDILAPLGEITSGSAAGGIGGRLNLYPTTAAMGSFDVTAIDNTGDFANVLVNAATTDARTWTLPDASGTIALTSGASGIVNSGTENQLAWYAANGTTVSGLATANNGLLVTSAGGVPSIGNTIGASISVTGSVTTTTGVTTGVAATSSGQYIDNTNVTNCTSYTITKAAEASVKTTFLQITVPATGYFIGIECFIINSRATATTAGTSLIEKRYFAIARNGSGTDVVLDSAAGPDFTVTTTTAGGAVDTASGATTIERNGAEGNTEPQVVNLTINPVTTGASTGRAIIKATILVIGSLTGLVIA